MGDKVQARARGGVNVSGGEGSDEKEKKEVRGEKVKWVEDDSDESVESDTESNTQGASSQRTSGVSRVTLSTRADKKTEREVADPWKSTSTATSATTSTTVKPSSSPSSAPRESQQETPAVSRRHVMPDDNESKSDRNTPQPPPRPRFLPPETPKASSSSTNSPPASPRRTSATSSVPPALTPRSQRHVPDTPRSGRLDVADRNSAVAFAMAGKLRAQIGRTARSSDFKSVLSQAGALAQRPRYELLLILARSLNSLPDDSKGACLAELLELAADMTPEFRKTLLKKLLKQLIENRDSGAENSSGPDIEAEAEHFASQHEECEARCATVTTLMKKEVGEESLARIKKRIQKTGMASMDLSVLETVIIGLDNLDENDQGQVINLFTAAGISCTDVLAALLQSPHGREMERQARSTGLFLSVLYLGALTKNHDAMRKLLLLLGKVSLPADLHLYVVEGIGELRRKAISLPAVTTAVHAMLLEIVSLSTMSEQKRCLLLHAVSAVDEDDLHEALKGGDFNYAGDYWAYAHQVMADAIDIGSCYQLIADNDQNGDLACYAARAGNLWKGESAKLIVDDRKCSWDAPRLRALILGKSSVAEVKKAVFNVLNSNLSPTIKLGLLKCEATPLGDSVESYVAQARYDEAVKQYKKKTGRDHLESSLAYEVVKADDSKYENAYKKLTKHLDPDAKGEIKAAGTTAMVAAQYSRLPALHVAAMQSKPDLIGGYIETVLGFKGQLPDREIVACLELGCNGISLFHRAMIKGTAAVIDACVSRILDSELLPKHKISLLEARRQPDRLGAFYVAMSCDVKATALAFVRGVLGNAKIDDKTKFQLLQCAKLQGGNKPGPDTRAGKELEQAAMTAYAEAERMQNHDLNEDFKRLVERSAIAHNYKTKLQTG